MSVRTERFCDLWVAGHRCATPSSQQCSVCGRDCCQGHTAYGTLGLSFQYTNKVEVKFPLCSDCRKKYADLQHFKLSPELMRQFKLLRDAVIAYLAYLKLPAAERKASPKRKA